MASKYERWRNSVVADIETACEEAICLEKAPEIICRVVVGVRPDRSRTFARFWLASGETVDVPDTELEAVHKSTTGYRYDGVYQAKATFERVNGRWVIRELVPRERHDFFDRRREFA